MTGQHDGSICPGCFLQATSAACPHCGYRDGEHPYPLALKAGTMLSNHFVVGKVLGKPGGFGITYLAWDNDLEVRVAIKEFLPQELAGRAGNGLGVVPRSGEGHEAFQSGLRGFLEEARILARFNHSNIVRVKQHFRENGTAYMVMDYYPGQSLWELLERRQAPLGEAEALNIILPVMEGLQSVHGQDFVHGDIKPQNIYLAEDGRSILLDFGTARSAIKQKTHGAAMAWTTGFAPLEQCQSDGRQGPWTDVYGLAATLLYMLGRIVPEDSTEAKASFKVPAIPGVSARTLQAIQQGLALRWQDRLQTVQAFRKLLDPPLPPVPITATAPGSRVNPRPPASSAYVMGCAAFYAGLLWLGYVLLVATQDPSQLSQNPVGIRVVAVMFSMLGVFIWLGMAYVFSRIGRKFGIGRFLGFSVPIYNAYLLCRCGGVSPWLILLAFVFPGTGDAGIMVWLLCVYALNVFVFGAIARKLGKGFWAYGLGSVLLGIPVLVLAFDNSAPGGGALIEDVDYHEIPTPSAAPGAVVEFLDGEFKGERIDIPEEGLVIGRHPAMANVVVRDDSVSGGHLKITPLENRQGTMIEDLESTNGSYYRHAAAGDWQILSGGLLLEAGEIVWVRLAQAGPVLKVY